MNLERLVSVLSSRIDGPSSNCTDKEENLPLGYKGRPCENCFKNSTYERCADMLTYHDRRGGYFQVLNPCIEEKHNLT